MVNAPQVSLKIIFAAHFFLSVWASMLDNAYLNGSYMYMNIIILSFGFWSIVHPECTDSIFMYCVLNVASIVMDIVFLGIFTPIAHARFEVIQVGVLTNTYRFCLGMAIVNLIIKPFTSFILYRIYQDRGGQYSDFNIPGMPGIPGFGQGRSPNEYEDIDHSGPSNNVETASPHSTIDKSPLP